MVANWRNSGGPNSGGVGCQSPGALPATYGGSTASNPSVARQAKMAPATVFPQPSPRSTDCPGSDGSSEIWATVAASWASNNGFCAGIKAASAVYAALAAAASREAPGGAAGATW